MWFVEMMHADTMRTAAGLLARRGYENVQASALAQALRISVGTLYRHYGSKPGLALAVRDFTEKEVGVGRAAGAGTRGLAGRTGGRSRSARLGPRPLASPGTRRSYRAARQRHALPR
jgi:hypothetical protein